jgi:AcrR family transcriptional regulator
MSTVGRPREHDERTGVALLDAAERIVERDGLATLSVRRLADDAGTTTRAVYSVFGSKPALIVALGARTFDWLTSAMDDLPATNDPVEDLIEAGVSVFRRLVVEHPSLFKVGVQQTEVPPELAGAFRASADNALGRLESRLERLRGSRLLGGRTVRDAACEFHALCEGLAAIELRGAICQGEEERIWREALTALVAGFGATPARRSSGEHVGAGKNRH